jgi:hypothetical protein
MLPNEQFCQLPDLALYRSKIDLWIHLEEHKLLNFYQLIVPKYQSKSEFYYFLIPASAVFQSKKYRIIF